MAIKRVTAYDPAEVHSGEPLAGQEANLDNGILVTVDSNGKLRPADYRVSQGTGLEARGFLTHDCQTKDLKGNVIQTLTRLSFTRQGRVGGMSASGGGALLKGKTYYLFTGGDIVPYPPATAVNDINQAVGYAETTDILVIGIGAAVYK